MHLVIILLLALDWKILDTFLSNYFFLYYFEKGRELPRSENQCSAAAGKHYKRWAETTWLWPDAG